MVVAILALTPAAMAIQYQPSAAQEGKTAQQANPTTPISVNCDCTAQTDDSKNKPQGWHKLVTWPEGIATWALIATLIAIIVQSTEMRRATNSQRSKDRARLDISIAETAQNYVLGGGNELIAPFFWEFVVEIIQRGDTKAFNVIGKATLLIKPSTQIRPTIPEAKMLRFGGLPKIIEGNESRSIIASIAIAAAPDDVHQEIMGGTMRAHFFGLIRYEDVFGAKHKSTFRYVWKPEIRDEVPGTPGETHQIEAAGWERAGRKKDNYSD